jgi:hypothetical protein
MAWSAAVALLLIVIVALVLWRNPDIFSLPETVEAPLDDSVLLRQQLATAWGLAEELPDKPQQLGQLVSLYRAILKEHPGQPRALEGLQLLPGKCIEMLSFYLATRQWHTARQVADDSQRYFPQLAENFRWQQLVKAIPPAIDIKLPAVNAAALAGQQLGPVPATAPDTAPAALIAVAPAPLDTTQASTANSDRTVPALPLAAGPAEHSQGLLVAGSAAAPLAQQQVLGTAEQAPESQLKPERATQADGEPGSGDKPGNSTGQLLAQARDFSEQGVKFTQQENAVTRYQDVLALEPGNSAARQGLQELIAARVAYVSSLIADGKLETARIMLAQALEYFPADTRLQEASAQLDQYGGVISSVRVDFMADNAVDSGFAASGGQQLLVSFNYKYFADATTVVTARLVSYPGLTPIAEVPVLIQEQRGSKSVQLSALTRKVIDGRYLLTLSVADNSIFDYQFVVDQGRVINTAP